MSYVESYVDMFLHPVLKADEAALFDLSLDALHQFSEGILEVFEHHRIQHGMVCLFDDQSLKEERSLAVFQTLKQTQKLSFSYVPNFRQPDCLDVLENAVACGFSSITFHPYLQEIEPSDFDTIAKLCQRAESLGLFICVCTAYGSKKIFRHHSLPLVVHLADRLTCPIVLVHGGGAKVLEAFLIAEMYPHIYFETSFSLPYWIGSTIETDIAFVMKRLGSHRCMFGSDTPFISLEEAFQTHLSFFERHHFKDADIEKIMGKTAATLLGI